MSEKGIKIADQVGGTSVAVRDAVEQTSGGLPRLIQLVDIASRHFSKTPHRMAIAAIDPLDVATAAAMYGARITVGDKSLLVAHFDVTPANFTDVLVTPVLYGADNSVIGILTSKRTGIGAATIINGVGKALLPSLQWDLFGAEKVSLHITAMTKSGAVSLNVFAEVL